MKFTPKYKVVGLPILKVRDSNKIIIKWLVSLSTH